MSLIKLGEASTIQQSDIQSADTVLTDPDILNKMADDSVFLNQFKKFADNLKQIAPKAKDFLYFSCIIMHAAEAALLNEDGSIKKDADGKPVEASWEKKGDSWRWVSSDPSVKPYRNSNSDIFPEEELIKAHKKWVGRPLCLDHKSSSVDMVRGVIVDTYYDHKNKRVIGLCALDKVNYPDLARKVATGYATSVSMGTAVGKAICTDCGTAAKVEAEFCDHMRRKSCYGEINIDLSPIELSIVVNGADPKAKIRHIVAAADSIAQYVEKKKEQLAKTPEDETKDIELASELEKKLDEFSGELLKLKDLATQLKGNEQAEQDQLESTEEHSEMTPVASAEDLFVKRAIPMLEDLQRQIKEVDNKLNRLHCEETEMTTKNAYFQGGGGPNEPTPGKPKYEKEDEDSIRAGKDKQMVGQMDMGPVDGMHPGYDSFGESEEARKKRLQRLAADEREMRRTAALKAATEALQKGAYYQGGGGVNEPTPGKPKYPKEEADKTRDKEDKQMVGQAPFPGVGAVDGLHPSPASADQKDELKRKQMLLRAKLTAKFIKAAKSDGSEDRGESRWQVYADDKLIMTATVNEITGNRADALFGSVATKEFGRDMLSRIKNDGFEKAASLYRGAQAMGGAAAASPMPAAPMDGGAGAVMAEPMQNPGQDVGMDKGKSGDPKEQLSDISHQLSNLAADLAQVDEALNEAPANELATFDQMAPAGETKAASVTSLVAMQKKLSRALQLGIKQTQAEIKDALEELKLAEMVVSDVSLNKQASAEKKEVIGQWIADAVADGKQTQADGMKLLGAFVKYARGTQALVKRARTEMALQKTAQDPVASQSWSGVEGKVYEAGDPMMPLDAVPGVPYHAPKAVKPSGGAYVAPAHKPSASTPALAPKQPAAKSGPASLPEPYGDRKALETQQINVTRESPLGGKFRTPQAPAPSGQHADDSDKSDDAMMVDDQNDAKDKDNQQKDKEDMNDLKVNPDGSMDGSPEEVGKAMKEKAASAEFDLSTKEGRAQYRTKLAEKGLQFSDMLQKAHGKGGFTTQLDMKPTGDLAKVETLEEEHKAMMDVATAPVKVRKDAAQIQEHMLAGKISEADLPALIANGVDPDAVKYWKSFYGQAKDGGGEFAGALLKDVAKKKAEDEKEAYKVKVARAFSLAHEMAEKDLIGKDASSINTQVNEMLEWSDKNFEHLKNIVARQSVTKKASFPQVGLLSGTELYVPAPEAQPSDLKTALDNVFSTSWKKRY